ncbi:MAG: helix-turn-helix domain-containing protein [Lachnospirales bacterium]
MNIGEKIKTLRIQRSLTQEELANRCELTKGFISQLERDLTSPSIATLVDILESLGTSLQSFFSDIENEKVIFEKNDIFVQEDEELNHLIHWIVPNAQKNEMEPIIITLKNGGKSINHKPFEGEVFGYILKGNITLHIGNKTYKGKKNESFYYKANEKHYIENSGKTEAQVLWVSSPPNF